jgi:D-arginine dehydrogenase
MRLLMTNSADIIVIGSGIAGASAAAHLAATHRVLILEMEERPGYHSTGRSAAAFEPNYGPSSIRALTRAAADFYWSPPTDFVETPILTKRETVFVAPPEQEATFEKLMRESVGLEEIPVATACAKHPLLRRDYIRRAVLDPGTADIDVDLLHQGYLRLFRARGGELVCNAPVESLSRSNGTWTASTKAGAFSSPVIVNAAGAWGGEIGRRAGLKSIGLQPKRRSIAVIPGPESYDFMSWPLIGDVGETWYCKPQSGKLLVSPADATPVDPHDAYADDMTLAEGIARFQEAVDMEVTRVERTWGGLRSFLADGSPVCGYDPQADGFFWLVGQGGYGIQTAPALSRLAAALVRKEEPPADILAEGLNLAEISPTRLF